MLKNLAKELLLDVGLYYKINGYRFRHDRRNITQRAFYEKIISKDDLVFDVGANIGQRADIFSQLARKVVAFEPQSGCIRHLKSRFRFRHNVAIEHLALSDKEGEATIYECDSHTLTSMSRGFIDTVSQEIFREYKWEARAVKTTTLDQMIGVYGVPRLIKIDVEGFELNVLNGLSHPVDFITFEFTPVLLDETRKCAQRIQEISERYRYNYCLGENLEFVLEKHVTFEMFLNTVLPRMETEGHFGDVYAVLDEQ